MQKIWVIEQGCYSDYGVVGVFSTEENAQRVATLINSEADVYDKAEVACWDLDPGIKEMNAGKKLYRVGMDYDGTVSRCEVDNSPYSSGEKTGMGVWKKTEAPFWRGRPIADAVTGRVWAKSDKQAIKIANEYRAQAIADGRMQKRD
jgi:hypothetical protein